jgi:hypothetical protein
MSNPNNKHFCDICPNGLQCGFWGTCNTPLREVDQMHSPLVLLRDVLRTDYIDFSDFEHRLNPKASEMYSEGVKDGLQIAIERINAMLDIDTLGEFICKTEQLDFEKEKN